MVAVDHQREPQNLSAKLNIGRLFCQLLLVVVGGNHVGKILTTIPLKVTITVIYSTIGIFLHFIFRSSFLFLQLICNFISHACPRFKVVALPLTRSFAGTSHGPCKLAHVVNWLAMLPSKSRSPINPLLEAQNGFGSLSASSVKRSNHQCLVRLVWL